MSYATCTIFEWWGFHGGVSSSSSSNNYFLGGGGASASAHPDDIYVIFLLTPNNDNTVLTPGYTPATTILAGSGCVMSVFWKRATTIGESRPSVHIGGYGPNIQDFMIIRGAKNVGSPFDYTNSYDGTSPDVIVVPPGDSSEANCRILMTAGSLSASQFPYSATNSSITGFAYKMNAHHGTGNMSMVMMEGTRPLAGGILLTEQAANDSTPWATWLGVIAPGPIWGETPPETPTNHGEGFFPAIICSGN